MTAGVSYAIRGGELVCVTVYKRGAAQVVRAGWRRENGAAGAKSRGAGVYATRGSE